MQVSLTARIVDMIWFDQQIHTYSYIGYTKPVYYGSKWRYTRDHTIAHIQYHSTLFYHQQFGGGKKNEPLPNCTLRHQTYWKAAREAADLIRGANPDPKHVAVTYFQMKTMMVAYRYWYCIIDSLTVCIASCLCSLSWIQLLIAYNQRWFVSVVTWIILEIGSSLCSVYGIQIKDVFVFGAHFLFIFEDSWYLDFPHNKKLRLPDLKHQVDIGQTGIFGSTIKGKLQWWPHELSVESGLIRRQPQRTSLIQAGEFFNVYLSNIFISCKYRYVTYGDLY